MEAKRGDYRSVEIPPDSVIYCDIPYKDTKGYSVDFDHDAFYKWARQQEQVVYVSEYTMPSDWVKIWGKDTKRKFSSSKATECPEGLYIHKSKVEAHNEAMRITEGRLF